MSLVPQDASLAESQVNIFTYVQVAVTTAALYDHALTFGREVELVWRKPPSLVTAFYVVDRYLGDAVFMYAGLQLFQFRAWGTLAYSWATQAIMQLRIYAMYRRSKRILALLLTFFFCEIAAIAFIIWRAIGPRSPLAVVNDFSPDKHYCAFSGVNENFTYLFIPFLCFEALLFFLAARAFILDIRCNEASTEKKGLRLNTFISVLARDSLLYFFVNLVACALVMGLWQSITELYANICVPFVMFLEVVVGTRLVLDFRERYARPDRRPVVSGRLTHGTVLLRGDDIQMEAMRISVRYDVETLVVREEDTP
ncbi:hypothetical protein PAXRUDRAFT_29403 [Paxillus rubicundulus Ve08.2h10]|uniref:DUF6533 domain-containing protein n=1 Tax=Paxillus rubicundulus Ve08.2h10 TaxID=930991 RepID=A0A0D0EB93_9AGAM|nr:hypothetical protein PAXRUDRAFT_29403 [Paxillus rubicundulus Ve08.2h10]